MMDFTTQAGEALFIPLGWRHYATPVGVEGCDPARGDTALSVHVTMGVHLPRWGDLLEGLLHQLGAVSPWLREPLQDPIPGSGEDGAEGAHRVAQVGQEEGEVQWSVSNADLSRQLRRLVEEAGGQWPSGCQVSVAGGANVSIHTD
jgi:hypothetical protein